MAKCWKGIVMKYAVVYYSETGNTQKVAEAIYDVLPLGEKMLYQIKDLQTAPKADVYFVGFSIRNNTCGIETMNFLDQIKGGKVALFATCGFYPADGYREQLEHRLSVWLPERAKYLGMFLCQGRIQDAQADRIKQNMPKAEKQLIEMFIEGQGHPDEADMMAAKEFSEKIQKNAAEETISDTNPFYC